MSGTCCFFHWYFCENLIFLWKFVISVKIWYFCSLKFDFKWLRDDWWWKPNQYFQITFLAQKLKYFDWELKLSDVSFRPQIPISGNIFWNNTNTTWTNHKYLERGGGNNNVGISHVFPMSLVKDWQREGKIHFRH